MPPLDPGLKASYNKMNTAGPPATICASTSALVWATLIVFANTRRNWLHSRRMRSSPVAVRGVQPLPDSMSAKFTLQWRYNGCVACREVCDGVCSAIRYGLSRRDAHGRLGNGCMRPAAAISRANRPPQSLSPCGGLADLAPKHEWRPLGRSHPCACPQRRPHLDFASLF